MVLLVTGGAGFIGSNFIRMKLGQSGVEEPCIVNLDALTYAGNLGNLTDVADDRRYRFVKGDVADTRDVDRAFEEARAAFRQPVTAIIHFAAESHVDRSIEDASPFLRTNVLGTQVLLDAARRYGVNRFVHVSTDEVYGSLSPWDPPSTEEGALLPNSPYAASKAASDLVVRSYGQTYGLDTVVTRSSNNYGPYQFPEKLIPLALSNALRGEPIPVYGDGLNMRDWMYVEDHCRGIDLALREGRAGEVYNFGIGSGCTNLELVRMLLRRVERPETLIRMVADRPGHDRRYALDATKARTGLGWEPAMDLEDGIGRTVEWYLSHSEWVEAARSGEYQRYYEAMYADRETWVTRVSLRH